MGPESLQASFWTMIVLQSIGSVDMPGRGARKMPSPRSYVAVLATWVILAVVADAGGQGAGRAAGATGWLLVTAGLVLGPFGQRAVGVMQTIAGQFQTAGTATPAVTTQTSTVGAS